jgi:uncharacterized protein (DUF2252 family)
MGRKRTTGVGSGAGGGPGASSASLRVPRTRVALLSPEERRALGKAARRAAPRSSHAAWEPAPERLDPVALLTEQDASRVPELVPIRYGRMLVSPFTFYRGAAAIMAADLAATPCSGLTVQTCGDAHLSNFGLFASPERKLLFDINDFDETLPGPWEWDVKRLAASFEIAGRHLGFSSDDRRDVVIAGVREYHETMQRAADMGVLETWYADLDAPGLMDWVQQEVKTRRLTRKEQRAAARRVDEALTRDSARVYARRTDKVGGDVRIVADPPLVVPIEDLIVPGSEWERAEELVEKLVRSYRRTLQGRYHPIEEYRYVHLARKVVGVGSVGTRCYILLFLGRDDGDPLFLQVKEAQASVLEPYVGASEYAHHGQRVVVGQRVMQAASDIFLGWQRIKGFDGLTRDYYVRQLHDWKGGADVENLRVPGATLYARVCARTLARAHARSGSRIAIASYLGRGDAFERAVARFCVAYADQNERDYEAFTEAVRSGRILAETGL